jgi:hypothetical protein
MRQAYSVAPQMRKGDHTRMRLMPTRTQNSLSPWRWQPRHFAQKFFDEFLLKICSVRRLKNLIVIGRNSLKGEKKMEFNNGVLGTSN